MAVNANNGDLTWPIIATLAGSAALFSATAAPSLSAEAVKGICAIAGIGFTGYGALHLLKAAKEGIEDRINRLIFPHPVKTVLCTALLAGLGGGIGSIFGPNFVDAAIKTNTIFSALPAMIGSFVGAGIGLYSNSELIPQGNLPQARRPGPIPPQMQGLVGNARAAAPQQNAQNLRTNQIRNWADDFCLGEQGDPFMIQINGQDTMFNSALAAAFLMWNQNGRNRGRDIFKATLMAKMDVNPNRRQELTGQLIERGNRAFWAGGISDDDLTRAVGGTQIARLGIDNLANLLIEVKDEYRHDIETHRRRR